jgi:hypothetical protein
VRRAWRLRGNTDLCGLWNLRKAAKRCRSGVGAVARGLRLSVSSIREATIMDY